MLRHRLPTVILLMFGSAAALAAAELLLFAYGTFNGCSLALSSASPSDLKWWERHVGAVPNKIEEIEQPQALSGRNGTWYHREAGPGADGADGWPIVARSGVAAFDMQCENPLIRGRSLVTNQQWAYHMGVALPFVFLERWHVGPANSDPGHPAEGWRKTFHFGPFALDVFICMIVIDMCWLWFHRVRYLQRSMRSRCVECAYRLLPTQTHCPECGARSPRQAG